MAKRRLAVIGAGMAIPPHAQSLLDLAGRVEVAGVFSRERDKLDKFSARFPLPVTDALEPLFADRSSASCCNRASSPTRSSSRG